MTHTQDGINYRIEGGIVKGWIGTSLFQKPQWNGSEIVEGWTQADTDEQIELEADRVVEQQLEKELQDGIKASMELKVYLQRNLSEAQFKSARVLVRPVFEALRVGDWDIALDEITIIDNANSTTTSQRIKTKIENYING